MNLRTIVQENPQNMVVMDVFSKLAQERIIFIDDVINDELANSVIAQLLYLDSLDSSKPINIIINSPGGSIMDGMAIYDTIKRCKSKIITTCTGMAASMAFVLLLSGDTRRMHKHSKLMMHEASGYEWGKTKDLKVQCAFQEELENELFEIVEEKTLIKAEDIRVTDVWYNAKKAIELKIVDVVLEPTKK